VLNSTPRTRRKDRLEPVSIVDWFGGVNENKPSSKSGSA